jgi:hypothetical protein
VLLNLGIRHPLNNEEHRKCARSASENVCRPCRLRSMRV